MNTKEFFYELPDRLIAQHPMKKRDHSKLLYLKSKTGEVQDLMFYDLLDLLNDTDTLVINDTRVLPARLYGSRQNKEEKIEVLLLKRIEGDMWECLVKPGRKMKIGTIIFFSSLLTGEVVDITEGGERIIKFKYKGIFEEVLDQLGEMPLPPYIKEKLGDRERYQTVYAKDPGSAAAPTAGLHFTNDMLKKIEEKGVSIVPITLHVGLGTFRPVKVDKIEDHRMHSEFYEISKEAADKINRNKKRGGRIIAVGTTSVRTLESQTNEDGVLESGHGWTDIFIYPGYHFKMVNAIVTNFHLPESTLLMLVSAFSSREKILKAYKHAVNEEYRFFSFGDAMFIE